MAASHKSVQLLHTAVVLSPNSLVPRTQSAHIEPDCRRPTPVGPDTSSVVPATRVLIFDDPGVIREAVGRLIDADPRFVVCAQTDDAAALVELVAARDPHVILCNLEMRSCDAVRAVTAARERAARRGVVAIAHALSETLVYRARSAAFEGLVTFAEPAQRMLDSIHRAAAGESSISPAVRRFLGGDGVLREPKAGRLSPREFEVVRLAARGHTSTEIAKLLARSPRTVENQLQSAMRKAHVNSRVDLVRWAIRERVAPP